MKFEEEASPMEALSNIFVKERAALSSCLPDQQGRNIKQNSSVETSLNYFMEA
jgi:hypothetical protein